MRLVTDRSASGESKLEVAATRIADLWAKHRDHVYRAPATGEPHPTPGALQLVFCDLSTPSRDWNAYEELRGLLAAHGVPHEQIRFIHEARNDAEKARLFATARSGQIAVLIGSTEKMGVGTNIQNRTIALHHVDCPWRPADIEQREGRGIRQGNQNPEIHLYRYVVEGSFDAYSWQTVERKARFIHQVMRGRLDTRQVDDIGDNALSYAEVKALASGDPLTLEKARADAEHTRLRRLHRAHQRGQHALRHTLATATTNAQRLATDQLNVQDAIARRTDTRGELFALTIGERTARTRTDAGSLIKRWATTAPIRRQQPLGQLAGLDIDATIDQDPINGRRIARLTLHGLPSTPATLELDKLHDSALSLVRQLEHRIGDLDALRARLHAEHQAALAQAAAAHEALARPFKYADQLQRAETHCTEIAAAIQARQAQAREAGPADEHETPPAATHAKRAPARALTGPPDRGLGR
jgi:hypothetical protein